MLGRVSFLFVVFGAASVWADVRIQAPCEDELWASEVLGEVPASAGELTVTVLELTDLVYEGSAEGIRSIGGTPHGDAALEIVSESEMRAYGWCYEVDGHAPAVFPHEWLVEEAEADIYWYFGFAHYQGGEWVSYCTPTHVALPAFICGD